MIAVLRKNYFALLLIFVYVLAVNLAVFHRDSAALLVCLEVLLGLCFFYVFAFAKKYVLPAIFFLVPLSFFVQLDGGARFSFPSEGLTALLALVFTVYALRHAVVLKRVLRHPITWLLAAELGWMALTSATSELPAIGYKRCIMRLCFLLVFYLLAAHWFADKKRRAWFFVLYAAGIIVPVIYTIWRHAQYDFNAEVAYAMCQPFYADHTIYGAALAFILPGLLILLSNYKRLHFSTLQVTLLAAVTGVVLAGEILSFSRAAWISVLAALVFYLLIRLRIRLWMLVAGLAVLSITVYEYRDVLVDRLRRNEAVSSKGTLVEHVQSVTNVQTDASNLERLNRWNSAIRMSEERPLVGFGPGTYQFEYGRYQVRTDLTPISTFSGNRGNAHSEFFTALSESGYPGLLLYLVLMFTVIGYGLRVIYRARERLARSFALAALLGLTTFYVHGIFNAFLDSDKMASLVFGAIAILVITDVQSRKAKRERVEVTNRE